MSRSQERIRFHYEIEKELANRIKSAPPGERRKLYSVVYEELYRRVPDHPRNSRKYDPEGTRLQIVEKLTFLDRFLRPDTRFLEIGAGDCSLTLTVAKRIRHAYAFDVARQIREDVQLPANFELIIMPDGCQIPLPENSVDLVYSNQVMEHIHRDDAYEQLENIHRVMTPGGRYICITPNRAAGPQDVSQYFDDRATCFHISEYRMAELLEVFRRAGFVDLEAWAGVRGKHFRISSTLVSLLESGLFSLPYPLRRPLANGPVLRNLLSLTVVGYKSRAV
jgi:SAM-dependent methyltransferase